MPLERIVWHDFDSYVDFFARIKFFILLVAALMAAILSLFHLKKYTDRSLYKYYALALGFISLVLISSMAQNYTQYISQNFSSINYNLDAIQPEWNISFWGFPERYEGLLAIASYFALFILTIKIIREEIDYKLIITVLMIASTVVGLIGLTQLIGHDLFKTDFGLFLMKLTNPQLDISGIVYTNAEHVVYSTLYNPNYVGSFVCLVLPITVGLWLSCSKRWLKWLLGGLAVLLVGVLIGSKSLAGFVGLFISILVWLVFNRKYILRNYKLWLPVIGSICILAGLFIGLSQGEIAVKIRTNVGEIVSSMGGQTSDSTIEEIEHISEVSGGVLIETTYRELYVGKVNEAGIILADAEGNLLGIIYNEAGYYEINDSRYSDVKMNIDQSGAILQIIISGIPIDLQFVGPTIYGISQNYNLYPVDYEVPSFGFTNTQTLATNRGYIWSKSLPILKDTLLIGTGPDTFAIVFPQYDFIGKANIYHQPTMSVDKPHSMYLQMAIQTGVLSLIIFMSLIAVYFVFFLKHYRFYRDIKPNRFLYYLNISIALSILGYLVAGIGNDTTIATASIFWVLLGLGISLQVMNHISDEVVESEIEITKTTEPFNED